jgi:hypothetical protein
MSPLELAEALSAAITGTFFVVSGLYGGTHIGRYNTFGVQVLSIVVGGLSIVASASYVAAVS